MQLICGEVGTCECGTCECDEGYIGDFCETCTSQEICGISCRSTQTETCIRCLVSIASDNEIPQGRIPSCSQNCGNIIVIAGEGGQMQSVSSEDNSTEGSLAIFSKS